MKKTKKQNEKMFYLTENPARKILKIYSFDLV